MKNSISWRWKTYGHKFDPYFINITEDERVSLIKRFREEGLDPHLSDERKLPYIWRWLVDAETNCLSLRKQIDKLHKQHQHDLKEVESYVDSVWRKSNERLLQLEEENNQLKEKLGQDVKNSIETNIEDSALFQAKSNNLCDSLKLKSGFKQIFQNSKGDKTVKNNSKTSSPKNSDKELKQLLEMCKDYEKAIKVLQRSKKDLEIERDNLAYKLTNAMMTCDHLEGKLITFQNKATKSQTLNDINKITLGNTNLTNSEPILDKLVSSEENLVSDDLNDLKDQIENLEKKYNSLMEKYENRKIRHKERMLRLRDHIERETKRWEQLFNVANQKRLEAEEELRKERELANKRKDNFADY